MKTGVKGQEEDNAKQKAPQVLNLRGSVYVVWAGIEPATQGFSVLCSTN